MKIDFDKFTKEALELFKNLSDNGEVHDAKRLWKVLGKLYYSSRIVSKEDLSVINEFVSSISFTEQFPPEDTHTYSMVAKKLRPLIVKKYNLGKKA